MKNKTEKINLILTDLKSHHNWSWAEELYNRNSHNLSKTALFYRGKEVSFKEMFENAYSYAKSMKNYNLSKNSEIPMCVSNSPEMVYIILAASLIGAKVNIFGKDYSKEYIKEIIKNSGSDVFFATDDNFETIKDIIFSSDVSNIIISSLTNSLPDNEDPYSLLDKNFYDFKNKVPYFKTQSYRIKDINEFIESGKNYNGKVKEVVDLEDEFLITYSSGSTGGTRPKGIVHCNRSLITMARFHDKDISTTPPMKNLRSLAHIPPFSNTDIITSISDSLAQQCSVALEPIYKKEFFPYSILINEPSLLPATRSFWIYLMKSFDTNKDHFLKIINDMQKNNKIKNYKYEPSENITLPFLGVPIAVGEPLADNEEEYLNEHLKKFQAGTKIFSKPISPVCMSIGGGDCEHGGLFFSLMKSYKDKFNPKYLLSNTISGLIPYRMVTTMIIDENDNKLGPNRIGRLIAKSPCTMKCYKNDDKETKAFFFGQDISTGTSDLWSDLNVFAYYDRFGDIHIKGRIDKENGKITKDYVPPFLISDKILKDKKNILSCEVVVQKSSNNENIYIANIEPMPTSKLTEKELLINTENRLKIFFTSSAIANIIYRIKKTELSFSLTECGKRDPIALQNETIDNCLKPIISENKIIDAQTYFKNIFANGR